MELKLDEIQIAPNRQRREFDPGKLQELADSIDRNGLLQPIVVRKGDAGESWILVAGERRLRAIRDYLLPLGSSLRHAGRVLGDGLVPVVTLGDLDPLAAEEAELEENIRRVDLTWQEQAAARSRLAELRAAQAAASGSPTPTTADLARELHDLEPEAPTGGYEGRLRKELILAKHLGNPVVASAKTADEAWKALKRQEELDKNAKLAQTIGLTFTAEQHALYRADSLVWMREQPSGLFDVILTDPPYGMGADEFGDSGGKTAGEHRYEDSYEYWFKIMQVLAPESFRLAKPQAHLYCFCDIDNFGLAKGFFSDAGWNVFRTPLIWHKPQAFRAPWPEHGPQRKYEICLFAVKGNRPVTRLFPDLVSYNPDENLGHNAQKPVALFEDLLRRSVRPGDDVADFFCGSGPIFPAAHALKCRATGVESGEASWGIAARRIQSLKEGVAA